MARETVLVQREGRKSSLGHHERNDFRVRARVVHSNDAVRADPDQATGAGLEHRGTEGSASAPADVLT